MCSCYCPNQEAYTEVVANCLMKYWGVVLLTKQTNIHQSRHSVVVSNLRSPPYDIKHAKHVCESSIHVCQSSILLVFLCKFLLFMLLLAILCYPLTFWNLLYVIRLAHCKSQSNFNILVFMVFERFAIKIEKLQISFANF